MRRSVKSLIYKFITILFVVYAIGLLVVYAHEEAHVAVNNAFGCQSEVTMNYILISGTTRSLCDFSSEAERLAWKQAQSNVDAVGYHAIYGIIIFSILMLELIFSVQDSRKQKGDDDENEKY